MAADPGPPTLASTVNTEDVLAALSAPTLAERDAATVAALGIGPPLARRLRTSPDDATATLRARRRWTFTGIHLVRAAYRLRHPRVLDFTFRGTLADALAGLADLDGLAVATELACGDAAVELDGRHPTLLAAIDAACAQAGCRAVQGQRGRIETTAGAEPPYPAAYAGAARLRVIELRVDRSTDFVASTVRAQLRLRLDWEWPLGALAPPELRLELAGARVHEATPAGNGAEILVDLHEPPVGAIALRGRVHAVFDGSPEEHRLALGGAPIEAHGVVLSLETREGGGTILGLEARDPERGRADTGVLGVSSVVLCIDDAGEECVAQVHRVRTIRRSDSAAPIVERWGLGTAPGFGRLAELRVRIAPQLIRHSVDFALPALTLS